MKRKHNDPTKTPYNECVKAAYFQILKVAKSMLATIEHEELRFTMVREEQHPTPAKIIIHEFINPLIYLRLELGEENNFLIHYGFEEMEGNKELSRRTAFFTRSVYRLTSKELTPINIEACVSNSWCITECSALYEYVEEQMKHHQFHLIKYKQASVRRKQMKAVA